MTRLLAFLLVLLAVPAWAEEVNHDTVTVLDSATNVTEGLTGQATYRTILIENGSAAAVYCLMSSDVTVNNGHYVPPNNGSRSFPYDAPWYCIAASSQSGVAREHVIITGTNQ